MLRERQQRERQQREDQQRERQQREDQQRETPESSGQSEYEINKSILELSGDFTLADVKRQYKRLIGQYHPDKVSTFGEKIIATAEAETKRINAAYEFFKKVL